MRLCRSTTETIDGVVATSCDVYDVIPSIDHLLSVPSSSSSTTILQRMRRLRLRFFPFFCFACAHRACLR